MKIGGGERTRRVATHGFVLKFMPSRLDLEQPTVPTCDVSAPSECRYGSGLNDHAFRHSDIVSPCW